MQGKKLKILIITRYFPPYASIASQRPYSWAKYWARKGHDISVLTYPEDPHDCSYHVEVPEQVSMRYTPNPLVHFLKNKIGLRATGHSKSRVSVGGKRAKNYLHNCLDDLLRRFHDARIPNIHDLWYFNALKEVAGEEWDIVVSSYAPPVVHLVARRLKRLGRARIWCADFRDLWIEHSIAKGAFPFSTLEEWLESSVCHEADLVTVVSQPLAETLLKKYGDIPVQVIFNGFEADDLAALPEGCFFNDSQVTLLYTGTLYKGKRDPEPLFAAINELLWDDSCAEAVKKLRIVIAGTSFFPLQTMIDDYRLGDLVSCVGQVERRRSLHMQRDAKVLLFLENETDCRNGVMTGKIFEYLSSGSPIWGIGISDDTGPGKLIVESGVGRNFGCNVEELKQAIRELALNGHAVLRSRERTIVDAYSRESMANKLLELLIGIEAMSGKSFC